jgi:hypothetical protein
MFVWLEKLINGKNFLVAKKLTIFRKIFSFCFE